MLLTGTFRRSVDEIEKRGSICVNPVASVDCIRKVDFATLSLADRTAFLGVYRGGMSHAWGLEFQMPWVMVSEVYFERDSSDIVVAEENRKRATESDQFCGRIPGA